MALEARRLTAPESVEITAPSALVAGQVLHMPDGRAAVVNALNAASAASGSLVSVQVSGTYRMAKTASVALLAGQELWWVKSTGKVSFSGDFVVGCAAADAAAAGTTVDVCLNVCQKPIVHMAKGRWVTAAALGLGATRVGEEYDLAFDNTAEAAMAAAYSEDSCPVAAGPIMEARVDFVDQGDDAALDINVGLANGTHATDFDSVTEACLFHVDGDSANICCESDDGTTEVAATDSTVDLVEGTELFLQIDARDTADIQMYIDGVNVLPATVFRLDAATGPLIAIAHAEKTSNDSTAEVRVKDMVIRSGAVG